MVVQVGDGGGMDQVVVTGLEDRKGRVMRSHG